MFCSVASRLYTVSPILHTFSHLKTQKCVLRWGWKWGLGVRERKNEREKTSDRKGEWLPWPGTAYTVPQYPCSTRFFVFAPSDEKTVIGLKVGRGRPLVGKLRMSAFYRCADWPKIRMVNRSFFDSSREHFIFTLFPTMPLSASDCVESSVVRYLAL